jgi:probable rRNA maturation factor
LTVQPSLSLAVDTARLEALIGSIVRRELPPGDYVVGLHVVDDESIQELNAEHRGKDSHTDVLSFPLHDPNGMRFVLPPGVPANLGDVVVSYPRAEEQARDFGHSLERELAYLVAHGVLHVLGYDHEEEADRRRMRQQEEAALAPLGLTR